MKILTVFSRFTGKLFFRLRYQKLKHDNLYFLKKQNTENYKTIVFYFPNEKYMHYGDHLFFEPAISLLHKQTNLQIVVAPTKGMFAYFQSLSLPLVQDIACLPESETLIVSKPEFYGELRKTPCDIFYIDTTFYQSKLPICNDIALKIASFLHLSVETRFLKFSPYVPVSKIQCKKDKVILFSNYIDSGFFRVTKNKNEKLNAKAVELKKQGYYIIHIGTKKDKQQDTKIYPFIDLDLRGKTTVDDLFYLAAQTNVLGAICYDAFIMHLMFMFEKKAFILFRGRFLSKNRDFILQKTIPPFLMEDTKNICLL